MTWENVLNDSRILYKELVTIAGYGDPKAIKKYMVNKLAETYEVSPSTMEYRLGEWPIKVIEKIDQAMRYKLDFLD